jgi:hypothetical protein
VREVEQVVLGRLEEEQQVVEFQDLLVVVALRSGLEMELQVAGRPARLVKLEQPLEGSIEAVVERPLQVEVL